MPKYASEKLSEAFAAIREKTQNVPIAKVFEGLWPDSSAVSNQLYIPYLLMDVRTEISFARMTETGQRRAIDKADRIGGQFLNGTNNSSNLETFKQKFSLHAAIEAMDDISDLLETAGLPRSESMNRDAVAKSTTQLLADLEHLDLPEQVAKLVRVKLNSVERLLSLQSHTSDSVIALNIKSVVADLLVDLDPYLEKEAEFKEKIIKWGKVGTHATFFALGLLADVSAVYELLPKAEEHRLIEDHSEQDAEIDK